MVIVAMVKEEDIPQTLSRETGQPGKTYSEILTKKPGTSLDNNRITAETTTTSTGAQAVGLTRATQTMEFHPHSKRMTSLLLGYGCTRQEGMWKLQNQILKTMDMSVPTCQEW